MPDLVVKVSKRGADRIRSGHLWIFRSDLKAAEGLHGGEIVAVHNDRNNFLAQAFYSSRSLIALRILTREPMAIDDDFWAARLTNAFSLRQRLVSGSDAFRVVYADSDLLSSIIIDKYGDYFVLQTLSQGSDRIKNKLADLIVALFKPKGIMERNDAKARELEGLPLRNAALYGEIPESIEILEGSLKFSIDIRGGQKTGHFLDQRENRSVSAQYAAGRALDCFSYSGGFALHMARSADRVTAVDISSQALEQAKVNAVLNRLSNVEFVEANVFDLLHDYDKQKTKFDMIVLDPPAFAKNKESVRSAARGYKEINLRAMKILNPGGVLMTCSCSYHISEDLFWRILSEAASDAHRYLQILEKRTQARDHPILLGVPESYYLKCFVLKVI